MTHLCDTPGVTQRRTHTAVQQPAKPLMPFQDSQQMHLRLVSGPSACQALAALGAGCCCHLAHMYRLALALALSLLTPNVGGPCKFEVVLQA